MMSIPSSHADSREVECFRSVELGVPMIYSARPAQSASESKARITRGLWFWQREHCHQSETYLQVTVERVVQIEWEFVAHLHNVMSLLLSLMWLWLCFLLPTCNLQDATCYQTDWLRFWGWSKMCRDRASHWKMLFKLPPWMTMSMVYKASILSDFRIFQVKGMYLKVLKRFRWTHHPILKNV